MSENNAIWCPGCSREVEGVCHHFHCAIGPNGMEAKIRSRAAAQDAVSGWRPINTRPTDLTLTYLVANAKGQVAPFIRGVIHNNVGSPWDWEYGNLATHWMPMPSAPGALPEGERWAVADQMIGAIEDRFPDWRSYRDLIDCIDCTLHRLREAQS